MDLFDNDPIIPIILYVGLLFIFLHHIKHNYKLFISDEKYDWYKILFLILIFIGIHDVFNTTTHIVKYDKKLINKKKNKQTFYKI
jgi:hypothetical protein